MSLVGLSLKTQELTAMFLGARLCCSLFMEGDIHTFLDFVTLVSTLWVVYMMRFKLKSTYIEDLDNMPLYYVVINSFHHFLPASKIAPCLWFSILLFIAPECLVERRLLLLCWSIWSIIDFGFRQFCFFPSFILDFGGACNAIKCSLCSISISSFTIELFPLFCRRCLLRF